MSSSNLSLVKVKGSVLKHKQKHQSVKDIIAHLETLDKLSELKKDIEFLRYVCNLVVNCDSSNKDEMKDNVLEIYKMLFPEMNNEKDLQELANHIYFLQSNKKIKKLSFVYSTAMNIGSWF